ncbi:MAG: ABC transporter substrate-binding protein [Desulfovibrionales bacterium]|nr:ABC transporter substrate-binding protein [Desulfovibrionales bacterium]
MKSHFIKTGTCTLLALLLTALLCATAFADKKQEARDTLQTAIVRLTDTLTTTDRSNLQENDPIFLDLEKQILGIFSLEQFSMRTVGKKWRAFTPAQKAAFKASFIELLKTTYFSHVSEYNGNQIIFIGERTNKKGDKIEVITSVDYKGKTLPVNYRMLNENGRWMVYDVLIEGVSMVKNYRTQFKEILRRETPEVLIAKLQEKAARIRQTRTNNN